MDTVTIAWGQTSADRCLMLPAALVSVLKTIGQPRSLRTSLIQARSTYRQPSQLGDPPLSRLPNAFSSSLPCNAATVPRARYSPCSSFPRPTAGAERPRRSSPPPPLQPQRPVAFALKETGRIAALNVDQLGNYSGGTRRRQPLVKPSHPVQRKSQPPQGMSDGVTEIVAKPVVVCSHVTVFRKSSSMRLSMTFSMSNFPWINRKTWSFTPGLRRPNAPVKGVNIQPYPVLEEDASGPEINIDCYPLVNALHCLRIFAEKTSPIPWTASRPGSRARTGVVGEQDRAIGKCEGRDGQGVH